MARRNRTAKKRVTRRRRSSSMSGVKGGVMSAVTIIAGAVTAQVVGKAIGKALPATTTEKTKDIIVGAAPIAIGYFLPKFIKSEMGKNLGIGMIAAGGLKLVQSQVPKLAGMMEMDYYANKPVANISGYKTANGNLISGYATANNNYIAGIAALQEMEKC